MESKGSHVNWGGRREKRAFFSIDVEKRILKTIRGKGGDVNAVTTKQVQEFIFKKYGKKVSHDYALNLLKKYSWTKAKRGSVIFWLRPMKPEPEMKRGPYASRQTRIWQLQKYMLKEKKKAVSSDLAFAFFNRSDWRNLIPKNDYIKYFSSSVFISDEDDCLGDLEDCLDDLEDDFDDFFDDDFDDEEDPEDENLTFMEIYEKTRAKVRAQNEKSNSETNPES